MLFYFEGIAGNSLNIYVFTTDFILEYFFYKSSLVNLLFKLNILNLCLLDLAWSLWDFSIRLSMISLFFSIRFLVVFLSASICSRLRRCLSYYLFYISTSYFLLFIYKCLLNNKKTFMYELIIIIIKVKVKVKAKVKKM
jgi:hypothetical protein